MPLPVGVFALITVMGIALSADLTGRLLDHALQLITILLITAHARYMRRRVEPKIDRVESITTRVIGEREPDSHGKWDGVERRDAT